MHPNLFIRTLMCGSDGQPAVFAGANLVRVFVFRHHENTKTGNYPLTERGAQRAVRRGEWLHKQHVQPSGIIHSDTARAAQTADGIAHGMKLGTDWEPKAEIGHGRLLRPDPRCRGGYHLYQELLRLAGSIDLYNKPINGSINLIIVAHEPYVETRWLDLYTAVHDGAKEPLQANDIPQHKWPHGAGYVFTYGSVDQCAYKLPDPRIVVVDDDAQQWFICLERIEPLS